MRWNQGRRSDNLEDRRASGRRDAARGRHRSRRHRAHRRLGTAHRAESPSILSQILGSGGGGTEIVQGPPPTRKTSPRRSPRSSSSRLCSTARRRPGIAACRRAGSSTSTPSWSSFATRSSRPADWASRRWGRSTVPPTRRSTSTSASTTSCKQRFGAPGDFAQAYVIAHEIGHHVQNLLGTERAGARGAAAARPGEQNALSVALELQADCFAGDLGLRRAAAARYLDAGDVRKRSTPRRRSATTGSSAAPAAGCRRNPSPTVRRNSA